MYGYAGKILHLDMSSRKSAVILTEHYRSWGGGHGMGSALFWDFCKDKTITDGRSPANVVCIMTSPLCGTIVPSAGGRCEVVGVGVGLHPVSWFTRSNFGGRFSTTLKYAGWDGIVVTGKADHPLWIDIRNDEVSFRDARSLWGKDTWTTQQEIWREVGAEQGTKKAWREIRKHFDEGQTADKPAVLAIGPAGESLSCHGCLIHDAGNGAGQGGFGAVWGAKNLKAISVTGTGLFSVADPAALLQARFATKEKYATHTENPDLRAWSFLAKPFRPVLFSAPPTKNRRPQACQGCITGCRARYGVGYGNESSCQETSWYLSHVRRVFKTPAEITEVNLKAADIVQKYGFNSYPVMAGLHWLEHLHEEGILGDGRAIPSSLPWEELGTLDFAEKFIHALATRTDIGADLADGWLQAALKWGREEDLRTGAMHFPYWGSPEHGYDPRAELEWGYGTIVGDRDLNSHCFNQIFWDVNIHFAFGMPMRLDAREMVETVAAKLSPYIKDRPEALDFGNANMYSEAVAQLVRWQLHYCRFWKQSALFCDLRWPNLYNSNTPDFSGATASADAGEQVFWNAVTGDRLSFEQGIELGRRIWNLDNAIWVLQGRHRDMVRFAPYIYENRFTKGEILPFYFWPCRDKDGTWRYADVMGRAIDFDKFEEWKTIFYRLEGWDTKTGWPLRNTLEKMELDHVADALEAVGKLGGKPHE